MRNYNIIKYVLITLAVICAGSLYSCSRSESAKESQVLKDESATELNKGSEAITVESSEAELFVYVCGSVAQPGVYHVPVGTRAFQVIEMAGGITEVAAQDALNLAETVADGQKIDVPSYDEWISSGGNSTENNSVNGDSQGSLVNINTADETQLMTLPGIGEARATAIIAYRDTKGKFAAIEEIQNVEGIKEAAFNKLKDLITVN